MSEFRTPINPTPSTAKIGLNQPILTVGSCFADTIGGRLKKFKFNTLANPFGILFSPMAIHKALHYALDKRMDENGLVQNQDTFYHYDFHSEFSSANPAALSSHINQAISDSHSHLKKANWILLTYGTAWVYTHIESDKMVANCHKMPAALFSKSLLTEKAIVDSFSDVYDRIVSINPDITIIITVSPVRHLKDTIELNTVSKSILRIACHSITSRYENVHYFPAYEMMMDDLRDYRFYAPDMIHPSPVAEDYIWDHFVNCFIGESSQQTMNLWSQILKDLEHKPFHAGSSAHQKFLTTLYQKIQTASKDLDVERELQFVKNQLNNAVE